MFQIKAPLATPHEGYTVDRLHEMPLSAGHTALGSSFTSTQLFSMEKHI